MSSKGRQIAKNLGKSIRKKFDSDSQTDDLQQSSAEVSPAPDSPIMQHLSASGETKSSSSSSPPSIAKSTSLSTIGNDPNDQDVVEHTDILGLTHDVKNFSDTLAKLKVLFLEGLETGDDARVVLQNSLGEVLAVLKDTMQRYPDLKTPEMFTAARVLINKIKAHDSEELQLDDEELQFYLDAIDQVALAFSRSVSEYLMVGMVNQQQHQPLNTDTKVLSCDNLTKSASQEEKVPEKQEPKRMLTPEELDAVLVGLESGLDLALQRAKAWSRYTRDVIAYIEKKSQLEMEYAKNLARIAHGMQPVLTSEGFLPLQSVFCTALSQDAEFASNLQASQALLHTSKFVEPLACRRSEHDRVRKSVKEMWDREVRRMQETVNNLRKAQALYVSRQQELERVRETLLKAEGDKMEKRKKSEEEALHKSAEAETTYKACVAEANHRQRSVERTKVDLLGKVRDQIHQCDQVIKMVTVDYFSLLHTVWSPVPVQYQTLCESSRGYEPGCQYAEFIKRLPSTASRPSRTDDFAFEAYSPGQKPGEGRKVSVHSNGSSGDHIHSNEGSPVSSPRRAMLSDKYRIPVKAWGQNSGQLGAGGSDTDSASGSNKSHESSPSSSPHDLLRRQIVSAQSLEELAEEDMDKLPSRAQQKRGQMKRTATVGDEDSLDIPRLMGQQGRRNTMFGVDFQEQVEHYKSQVPPIITQCLAEIERRGVMIKGIYRVSGVKSKVESLCQRFDLNPELVDLEAVHPNIISNVLKLYLRQLPEPLLSFRLYSDFIHLAKENMSGCLTGESLMERLSAVVRKLPTSNFRTCAVLMHHLHRVAAHSELNHMSCSNLGIVFGPTLLRPLEGTASLASLVDTPHQTRAVELLITNAEVVFGPGDDYQLVPDETPVETLETTPEDLTNTVPSSSSEPSPERSPSKDVTDGFLASLPMPVPALALSAASAASTSAVPVAVISQSAVPPAVVSQSEDSAVLLTDLVPSTPSLEPAATDFSLPGSASLDQYDNVFVSNAGSSAVVDGGGLKGGGDSDNSTLSSLEDDEDDDDDVMFPDQSSAPNSQSHTPLLTPHCMAESMRGGQAMDHSSSSRPLAGQAPLADMDPAPDTTLPSPLLAVVDSSTWPGPGGRGSASLPASPTIKPQHTSSTSSAGSALSDGRLSPTKDSRADRFKLEQRKLLSAIKSDPKLGMVVGQGGLTAATSHPRLLSLSSWTEGEGVFTAEEEVGSEGGAVQQPPPPAPLSAMDDLSSPRQNVATAESIPFPAESIPVPAESIPIPAESIPIHDVSITFLAERISVLAESLSDPAKRIPVSAERIPIPVERIPVSAERIPIPVEGIPVSAERIPVPTERMPILGAADRNVAEEAEEEGGGESVSEVCAAAAAAAAAEQQEEREEAVSRTQEDLSSSSSQSVDAVASQSVDAVPSSPAEKRESKGRKLTERCASGIKSPGNTTPGRSGIRLGTGSSSKLDSPSSGGRSGAVTMGGKVSPAGKMSRPSTVSIGQRRSNITGLSGGGGGGGAGGSPHTSPHTTQARSVLTRYPPSSTPSPSSTSRRSIASLSPSSSSTPSPSSASRRPIASLSPASTLLSRSSPGSRRSAPYASSPDSSPRGGPSSSTSSDSSSPTSISGSGARGRRLSGEKSSASGRGGGGGGGGGARENTSALRAGGNGSLSKAGVRSGGGVSPRNSTAGGVGKPASGGGAVSKWGTNGASRQYSATSTASTASVGAGRASASLSSVVESSQSTVRVSSVVATEGAATTTATASGAPFQEQSQDQTPAESSSVSSGAKDLSSDRRPRFV